jgi:hypothetical protein
LWEPFVDVGYRMPAGILWLETWSVGGDKEKRKGKKRRRGFCDLDLGSI